ncbi:Chorein N-terminal domain-containing protein [Entamoeba marina]
MCLIKKGNEQLLKLKGEYSIDFGNIQLGVELNHPCLILTPQFITQLTTVFNEMFDGLPIPMTNSEPSLSDEELKLDPPNNSLRQSIGQFNPRKNSMSSHGLTSTKELIQKTLNEKTQPSNRESTILNEISETQSANEIQTQKSTSEGKTEIQKLQEHEPIELKESEQFSPPPPLLFKKKSGKITQPVQEIIDYLNTACPLPLTFAELVLVLKANYEWKYSDYQCEYICHELISLQAVVPISMEFCHLPSLESPTTYKITKNDMSDILLDISSFQERRPLSNVPPTIPKHLITITLISTAIIAVQDDSPDTAILQVTLDAHVLHRITSIGSITTSEIKIGDVRTCFAKGRVFDPQKGIELSKELNISLQIHSDAYEDWSSLRGSVTLDQTKLLTTFTDWRLILYFISLLSKFGGSVEPTIDSETSITIDVNNFKFVLGNPLRRDPLLRVKIPTASISYRSRNDDSIVRVMGALKIDGYNPHITDYDCLLEETLVSFRRRVVTDNVHGDPMERVLTLCALNNVNVVITSDVATELRRVFGLNDWNETNEEKEGFIAIQFIDYFSDQEPLMVSVNNYGIVRLRREPTWFENLPQKREYSDLKKCVVFTSTGEGVEVPISTEGESVYTLSEGNLVANVKIQNDSSREVIFSTLLALQNHLDDEAFVTISYGDLPELTATIQSDEIYYIPPKYFEGTLTLCTVRLARFSVVLKELQEDGIHKTLFDKCILCTTQHHNIKTYTQKIIKLSPPLIIQNHLPLPFTFNTNESNLPISPLSSLTTFSSPDAFISITIAGYHQTFIPRTSNILPIYSDTHSSITLRITWTLGCVRIDAEEWIYNRSFLPLSFSIEKPTSFIHNKRITYSNTPLPLTRGTKPLYVGIGNVWSAPIRGEKAQEIIRIIDKGMTYDIIMSVEPVNGVAYQTRQVVFRPALLISNELLVPIYCRISSKSKDVLCIQPNNIKPVYGKFKIDKSLEIAADYRGVWCKIPLTQESHFQMVMCRDSDGYEQATTVFISHSDSIVVHFQEIHTSSNYVLKNATKYPLTYQYRNAKPIQLPSYHLAHLCFPNTSALSSLFITSNFTHDETFEYQLDKPSVHEALAGTLGIVYSFTYIDNGVHTLVFTHNWQEMRNSVGALLQRTTTLSKSTTITTIFELSIACKTIGIDLIDNDREEVAFCSFQDVYYTQVSSPWKTTHSSNVGKIQIDANASDVEIAVPLSCDGVTFTLDVVSQENNASLYIPECILTIQPLIISLETSFLERIISFITNLNITPPPPPPLPTPSLYPTTVTFTPPQLITFESLIISQLQLELTFSIAPSFFLNLPYNAMTAPLHLIGTSVLTINSAPLHFSTFTSTWLFITPQRLIFLFTDFYRSQATQQLLTAVSSMQLIGAPGVLVHSISSGLSDFIHFPSTLHSNGESYRHGIAQGTASLLRHSIYGVSTSITALTSTFGNLAASLSFDQDFIKSREKRTKAYGATDGFTRGISQCGTGVFDGLKGVVSQPFKGALHHGIPGFFWCVIKPLTGVIDMAATTSEGISAVSNISKQRIRVPRSSCKGRSVTSFNSEESLIARYLQTKGFGEYIAHIGDPSGWVVLTDINLVIMNTQKVILKCPHQDLKMWIRDKNVDFSYLGKRLFIINSSQNKSCRNFLRSSMKYIKLGND